MDNSGWCCMFVSGAELLLHDMTSLLLFVTACDGLGNGSGYSFKPVALRFLGLNACDKPVYCPLTSSASGTGFNACEFHSMFITASCDWLCAGTGVACKTVLSFRNSVRAEFSA